MELRVASSILVVLSVASIRDTQANGTPINGPRLRTALLRRADRDTSARSAHQRWTNQHGIVSGPAVANGHVSKARHLAAEIEKVDKANTRWLKQVVARHGWPAKSLVGWDGAHAAWLLVQHADLDREFQRQCLDLMASLPVGEIESRHVAYLTDRLLVAEGRKQLYGTQFLFANGQLTRRPIADEANLDQRRAKVGLEPFAEYEELIKQQHAQQTQPARHSK